jgi:hypothetical protein
MNANPACKKLLYPHPVGFLLGLGLLLCTRAEATEPQPFEPVKPPARDQCPVGQSPGTVGGRPLCEEANAALGLAQGFSIPTRELTNG